MKSFFLNLIASILTLGLFFYSHWAPAPNFKGEMLTLILIVAMLYLSAVSFINDETRLVRRESEAFLERIARRR